MADSLPQFYPNHLLPIAVQESNLRQALRDMRNAIRKGIQIVLSSEPPVPFETKNATYGTIFTGDLGIALTLLRLHYQMPYLRDRDEQDPFPDLKASAEARVDPSPLQLDLQPGRPSPLESKSLGATFLRVLSGKWLDEDPIIMSDAVKFAIEQPKCVEFRGHTMGVDEILHGRAGLLWAILEVSKRCPELTMQASFASVYQAVPHLAEAMLEAGKHGAIDHRAKTTDEDIWPLMWPWIDHFNSLGAMHGITGILSVLISKDLQKHYPDIVQDYQAIAITITGLSEVCIRNNGQLPMSIPPFPSSRPSPLVQMCHGAPGLLCLFACVKRNHDFVKEHWNSKWDEAIRLASYVAWEQGLLSKGGGLCHGIAGNALPLLLLVNPLDTNDSTLFSRGLAMLLAARDTHPFSDQESSSGHANRYQMPDNPLSLFEGLSGTICAWAEACIVIETKLRQISLSAAGLSHDEILADKVIQILQQYQLGFPFIGGGSPDSGPWL